MNIIVVVLCYLVIKSFDIKSQNWFLVQCWVYQCLSREDGVMKVVWSDEGRVVKVVG